MRRSLFALAFLFACQPEPDDAPIAQASLELGSLDVARDHLAGDVYHYAFTIPVGAGPNAVLRVHRVVRERAPWRPRPTTGAVMMMHGDFATFATSFAPALGDPPSTAVGLAPWLAARDIDVWGLDRRWTQAPEVDADLADFAAMGVTQELGDIDVALGFARAVRLATDGSRQRLTLLGFSRGGQLGYLYAARDGARPPARRQLAGLVALDIYAAIAPADEELRLFACDLAAFEQDALAAGDVDVPNDFQYTLGRLALSDPDGPSPYFPGRTNRIAMVIFVGRTHFFFPVSPLYHLAAATYVDGVVSGLRSSSEDHVARWLAGAAPHQSLRESAETDALLCGDGPPPVDLPLSDVRAPLLVIAAAGGYGAHALYTATQVGSTDVTTRVVRQLPPEREEEDIGHADLLFSPAAPALAWQPLLTWLRNL